MEALGEATLGDEFGEAVAVGVVGEVDGFAVGGGAADEAVIEAISVGSISAE